MNILFYLHRFPGFGGIETVTELIGCYLSNRGHCITILAALHQERESELMHLASYFRLPDADDLNSESNYEFAESLLMKNKIEAIVFQNSYAPNDALICKLSANLNVPLYIFEHNTPLYLKKIYRLKRWWHPLDVYRYVRWSRRVFKHNAIHRKKHVDFCKKYVLLSKRFVNEFIEYVGNNVEENKITYINNPIVYAPIDKGLLQKKENIILCVSRIEDIKRIDLMIKLWEKTDANGWKFVIVGDGADKDRLMRYCQKRNIQNIEWVPFCNPTPYYERAKLFWMTSLFEGWGMTVVEAMQKGCVPIAYNSYSSIYDIIDDGVNGYIIKDMCQSQFIRQTRNIIKNESLYKNMAVNAIEKVKQFDVNTIGAEWERLLNNKK